MRTEVTGLRAPADLSTSGHFSSQHAVPQCEFSGRGYFRRAEANLFPVFDALGNALDPVSTGAAIDIRCPEFDPRMTAREFLAAADRIVDELSAARVRQGASPLAEDMADHLRGAYLGEFYKAKYGPSSRQPDSQTLPVRFKREPDIFLPNVRFGRIRLFLSRFMGDLAWFGVSL